MYFFLFLIFHKCQCEKKNVHKKSMIRLLSPSFLWNSWRTYIIDFQFIGHPSQFWFAFSLQVNAKFNSMSYSWCVFVRESASVSCAVIINRTSDSSCQYISFRAQSQNATSEKFSHLIAQRWKQRDYQRSRYGPLNVLLLVHNYYH